MNEEEVLTEFFEWLFEQEFGRYGGYRLVAGDSYAGHWQDDDADSHELIQRFIASRQA